MCPLLGYSFNSQRSLSATPHFPLIGIYFKKTNGQGTLSTANASSCQLAAGRFHGSLYRKKFSHTHKKQKNKNKTLIILLHCKSPFSFLSSYPLQALTALASVFASGPHVQVTFSFNKLLLAPVFEDNDTRRSPPKKAQTKLFFGSQTGRCISQTT